MILNNRKIKDQLLRIDNFIRNCVFAPMSYRYLLRLVDFVYILITKTMIKNDCSFEKLKKYKTKARVFVVANGPSLASERLESIIGEDLITMNFFIKHKDSDKIIPKYHVMADPADFNDAEKNLNEALKLNANCFVLHSSSKKIVSKFNLNNNVVYFNPAVRSLDQYIGGMFDFDTAIPRPRSSAQLAMMLALYLGYEEIYLLGVDDDQLSKLKQVNTHFYEQSSDELETETSSLSYLERLYGKAKSFEGYCAIKRISDNAGVKIVNLNVNSRLDIFEFGALNDIVESV